MYARIVCHVPWYQYKTERPPESWYPSLGLNFHVACYFHVGQKHNARLLATRGSAACARSRRRCCGTPQALAMVERMVRIGQAVRLQHIMQYRERRRAV